MPAPTDHVESVFGLPITHTSAWIFNCYVIEADGGVVLVDPGLPVVARRALERIGGLGYPPASITSVMCTHGHPDHVGGVSTILRESAPEVHLPARCREYLDGVTPRTFPLIESSLRFAPVYADQPFDRQALVEFARLGRAVGFGGPTELTLDFEPAGFLGDGDAVPGAPGWEVVHAPGHTDDSTCFYHRDTATLISGDAVVTQDGSAWFNPEYVCLETALATEEKLRSLEVRHLLPGHGVPLAASDVWATARSATSRPTGDGLLARCSRRLARWPAPGH